MEEELKEEKISKEQQSRGMNLAEEETQNLLNLKGIDKQLSFISQKNEDRKISEQQITYLCNQFLLARNKAANLLRKMDLKQAILSLVSQ